MKIHSVPPHPRSPPARQTRRSVKDVSGQSVKDVMGLNILRVGSFFISSGPFRRNGQARIVSVALLSAIRFAYSYFSDDLVFWFRSASHLALRPARSTF